MIKKEDSVKIGYIGKVHGLKGEVTLKLEGDVWEDDAEYLVLEIDGIMVPFFIESYQFKTDETALVKFKRTDNEQQAQNLSGCSVYLEKKQLSEENASIAPAEENTDTKGLIGYTIINKEGTTIGVIEDVDTSTVNELLCVGTPTGSEIIIPAADDYVINVNDEQKVIQMELPEGLLDLDD